MPDDSRNGWSRSALLQVAALLLLTLTVSQALLAQEPEVPQIIEMTIGCREEPSARSAASVAVLTAWIEENALFADLAVTNDSRSDIRVPARNPGGHYWDAVLYDGKGEPVIYCGGVSMPSLDPIEELVAESDVLTVKSGQTVTLRRVYLAPVWSYLRERAYDAQSFKVIYTGWSSIVVHPDASRARQRKREIEAAERRQCALYGGKLESARRALP